MITPQGWLLGLAGAAMVVVGRLLGILELFVVGVGLVIVVLAALVVVARTRLELQASRILRPPRVHAGSPGRVDLRILNESARRTPVIELRDPVGDDQVAAVLVAPMWPDTAVDAQYAIDTSHRGIVRIGPLSAVVSDPFGLARAASDVVGTVELTVLPALDAVAPLPHTSGDDPHDGTDHPSAVIAKGDEFYALRPYVVGDDLRRVHWKTTARRDELVVRQDHPPWQARSTILLETRHAAHTPESFERAVSAAASVAAACATAGHLVRLVTTGGYDSGTASGHAHLDELLERLAVVRTDAGRVADGLALLHLPGSGGALAVLLGRPERGAQPTRAVRGYQRVVALAFGDPTDDGPFPERWRQALAAGRLSRTASSSGIRR
ncbi:MAG: DUF58 domain-containing protein [Acidimicrobiia bacterium]